MNNDSVDIALVNVIENELSCNSLSLCVCSVEIFRAEMIKLRHYLIVGKRRKSINARSVNKSADIASLTGSYYVLCTVDVNSPREILHAGVDINNSGKMINNVNTLKSLVKRFGIGNVTVDLFAVNAVKYGNIFTDKNTHLFAAVNKLLQKRIADMTRCTRDKTYFFHDLFSLHFKKLLLSCKGINGKLNGIKDS